MPMRGSEHVVALLCLAAGLAGLSHLSCAGAIAEPPSAVADRSLPAPAAATTGQPPRAAVKSSTFGQSVFTVEELLRLENELVLHEAEHTRSAASPSPPAAPVLQRLDKLAAAPLVLSVDAIMGVGDTLRADLSSPDGESFANLRPGSRLRDCEVERIANRCVVFRPVSRRGRRAPAACPSVCWTGLQPAAPMPATLANTGGPVLPLPPGLLSNVGTARPAPAAH
ncbi:MAG: hypothetical protein JWQ76_2554 [Ramlibacter sp.]|nr:hypothetical protein [Ramlibacter sp.]